MEKIPSVSTHGALLLYVLAQHKQPIQHIDLVRQVFPLWTALTRRTVEWLALSDAAKKNSLRQKASLARQLSDTFSSLIIREVQPNADRYISLNPKHRASVVVFSRAFWQTIKPFLSMDDIRKVQAELERVYPSKRKLAPIPL